MLDNDLFILVMVFFCISPLVLLVIEVFKIVTGKGNVISYVTSITGGLALFGFFGVFFIVFGMSLFAGLWLRGKSYSNVVSNVLICSIDMLMSLTVTIMGVIGLIRLKKKKKNAVEFDDSEDSGYEDLRLDDGDEYNNI